MSFKEKMEETSKKKKSNIILALDFPFHSPEKREELLIKAQDVVKAVHPYICAVKINHHLVLPLGAFDGVQKLITQAHKNELLTIMDCKANDIGTTNQVISEYYYAANFDALIANPFIGWKEGLKPIFDTAHRLQRGVILLTYMSHKGACEGYGQTICDKKTGEAIAQYVSFAKKALKWNADGAVVGATYPEKIEEIHEILGESVPIYSPGIGAQGGLAKTALEAGAHYLIVGRKITMANNPSEVARKLCSAIQQMK
jgi:orotidine-5'-phosphate decarboxylase